MSAPKRPANSSSSSVPPAKRAVTVSTVQKWIRENDKTMQTMTWLKFKKCENDAGHVASLLCSVCQEFDNRLRGMKNYNSAFVTGATNLRSSNFKDHAKTEMHSKAMSLYRQKSASSFSISEVPIVKAISRMDSALQQRMVRKFEVAYTIAKEGMAFRKMTCLCNLIERQGVDLGEGYKTNMACSTFVDFIAENLRFNMCETLQRCTFFSLQMDGSTDAANIEEEIFLSTYLDVRDSDCFVHVRNNFLCVRQPMSTTAVGLADCVTRALSYMGIDETEKLVGFGCDGANVNIGDEGLRGKLEVDRPWLVTTWCVAHRLELALKDSLKTTIFHEIDEMLMQIYYLYTKSPKKCRELDEVITEMQACFEESEFSVLGGNRPIRACGTRFIAHKVAAIYRFIECYGAYLNHLTSLSQDPRTKAIDKAKLKGYILRWRKSKILLGCALFHDILKSPAILCKVLQDSELCLVRAVEGFLHTNKNVEKLKAQRFEKLPTVEKVLLRLREDEEGKITYQGVELTNHREGLEFLKNNFQKFIDSILQCLTKRFKCQNIELFTHTIKILATHGWEKTDDASFGYDALAYFTTRFSVPLEHANIDCSLLQQEWDDIVDYGKMYLNLTENYRKVWWKLFNNSDSVRWSNILALIELLFTIPVSNGHLERCFSQMKILKTDKRSSLNEQRLDNLLRIQLEGPSPNQWDAKGAVQLWWNDKTRRTDRSSRRPSSSAVISLSDSDNEDEPQLDLNDWEQWLEDIGVN